MLRYKFLRLSLSAREKAIQRADNARDRKDPALAARRYQVVIDRWGPQFDILVQLGNALKDSGAFDQANEIYGRALKLNPRDADCHLQLGHLMKLSGDLSRARQFYAKAVHLNPKMTSAREELRRLVGPQPPQTELDLAAPVLLVYERLSRTFQWRRG